jgi:hypothetical protein
VRDEYLRLEHRECSGQRGTSLLGFDDPFGSLLGNKSIEQAVYIVAMALGNTALDGADFRHDLVDHFGWIISQLHCR